MYLDERKVQECSSAAKLFSCSPSRGDSPCIPSSQQPADAKVINVHENDLPENNKVSKQISKDDLLCLSCEKLLVRPVVLNCGHGIILHLCFFDKYFNFRLLENFSLDCLMC